MEDERFKVAVEKAINHCLYKPIYKLKKLLEKIINITIKDRFVSMEIQPFIVKIIYNEKDKCFNTCLTYTLLM